MSKLGHSTLQLELINTQWNTLDYSEISLQWAFAASEHFSYLYAPTPLAMREKNENRKKEKKRKKKEEGKTPYPMTLTLSCALKQLE